MKRAIVSGATGFVGTHLVAELLAHGIKVTALCRKGSRNTDRLPASVEAVDCGMDDYDRLPEIISGEKAEVFFHLAWEGATGPERADALLQMKNAERTLSALKAAKVIGCEKFVAAGTVYEHFREQMTNAPVFRNAAFYILSKQYARDMARQLSLRLGIGFVWCRFCHPVGRYMKPEQLFAYTVGKLLDGTPPEYGPARDWFDVIDAEDLAAGLYLAGTKALTRTDYYIGSGEARALKDYLTAVPDILRTDTPVAIGQKPDDGMRFEPEWFDGSAFADETGFKPRHRFTQTILRLKEQAFSGSHPTP